jgi:hypothetical protein
MDVLREGQQRASAIARQTMSEVREAIGLPTLGVGQPVLGLGKPVS